MKTISITVAFTLFSFGALAMLVQAAQIFA